MTIQPPKVSLAHPSSTNTLFWRNGSKDKDLHQVLWLHSDSVARSFSVYKAHKASKFCAWRRSSCRGLCNIQVSRNIDKKLQRERIFAAVPQYQVRNESTAYGCINKVDHQRKTFTKTSQMNCQSLGKGRFHVCTSAIPCHRSHALQSWGINMIAVWTILRSFVVDRWTVDKQYLGQKEHYLDRRVGSSKCWITFKMPVLFFLAKQSWSGQDILGQRSQWLPEVLMNKHFASRWCNSFQKTVPKIQ